MAQRKGKKKTMTVFSSPVFIERRFRVVSDDDCERIRRLWLVDRWTQVEIADAEKISAHTVGVVCRSTPAKYYNVTNKSEKIAKLRDSRRKIRGGKDR